MFVRECVMKVLFNLLFFFSFFSSFSVINFPSSEWGLQMSWAIALIIFVTWPFCIKKYKWESTPTLKKCAFLLISLLGLTILDWSLESLNLIKIPHEIDTDLKARSVPHFIYLIFDALVSFHIVCYLCIFRNNRENSIKWLVIYPFWFITIWGIYQWITTFDILPYLKWFNNNASTGFTYLRFKSAHRTASIFPEPSEYAYFLAFMAPFIYAIWRHRRQRFLTNRPKLFVSLWIISVLLCQSMSLFAVLPLIFVYIYSRYNKITGKFIMICMLSGFVVCGAIIAIAWSRISELIAGDDGSAITRFDALIEEINLFKISPWTGVGFGSIRGLDLLGFLLATVGIIGACIFFSLMWRIKCLSYPNQLFKQSFVCVIIVTFFSNPVLDHLFLWSLFAFMSINFKNLNYENRLHFSPLQSG